MALRTAFKCAHGKVQLQKFWKERKTWPSSTKINTDFTVKRGAFFLFLLIKTKDENVSLK